jgi:hypothetical protein
MVLRRVDLNSFVIPGLVFSVFFRAAQIFYARKKVILGPFFSVFFRDSLIRLGVSGWSLPISGRDSLVIYGVCGRNLPVF